MKELIPPEIREQVKPVTFININFFEHAMDYLGNNQVNFFELLDGYHAHISNPAFDRTPFEVYAMAYIKQILKIELKNTSLFLETVERIRNASLGLGDELF